LETISVPWKSVGAINRAKVTDREANRVLLSQAIDNDGDGAIDELIFQADFEPKQSRTFAIAEAIGRMPPDQSKVFGRFVPERYDDFAWENDRIAFRMYGPTLETVPNETGGSGIDVRVKRGGGLVLDEWYKRYRSGGAHRDIGDGADLYKVGLLRGCGGTAIWLDEKLHYAKGFRQHKVIANGPIRFIAELTYEPWQVGDRKVWEVKRITLDAGDNLNHFHSTFKSEGDAELTVAIGLQKHQLPGTSATNREQGWIRYWDPADPEPNGNIGAGALMDTKQIAEIKDLPDHVLILTKTRPGQPVSFWAGAGWDKSGDFADVAAWDAYLQQFARRIASPIKVTLTP
jgi:hypothetical protein